MTCDLRYPSSRSCPLASAACSNKDPFAKGPDASTTGDGNNLADANTVDAAPHRCAPAPKRIIVLGDSITACTVVTPDHAQSPNCVSKQFSDYVIAHYGPGASYENYAVGGAKLAGIAAQLTQIPAAPGPALVTLFIGGNDLSPYIFGADMAAMTAWTQTVEPKLVSVYDAIFAALADTTKFPDGATLLMNSQYNPFDDCAAGPYNVSLGKSAVLKLFNDRVAAIAAAHGDAAILVDQHTPYLGHGHCYAQSSCSHYMANAAPFMADLIHANAAGNAALAVVANSGADRLYRDCIP